MNLEQQTPKETRVFISYSHDSEPHKQHVLKLANHLRSEGIDAVIDQYHESSPPPEGWQKWMDQQIDSSDFVIVICSEVYCRRASGKENMGEGRGVKWESTLLYLHIYNNDTLNSRFIPVLLPSGNEKHIPIPLQSTTYYRYPEGFENLYRRLTDQPRIRKPEIGKRRELLPLDVNAIESEPNLPNPYRGLEAFREQDAKNFFGRDEESKDLAQLVKERHFVAVLGNSGSGKSSLVFAGLIPELRQTKQWVIVSCRPKNQPLRELAVTLLDTLYQTELNEIKRISEVKELVTGLEQHTFGLAEIIARVFDKYPPCSRLLLVIDQFEELYTLSPEATQPIFLSLLLELLENQPIPPNVTVLITLRADFLGYALSHARFAKLLDTYRNKMLGDLSEASLSLAIEQPAHALNVNFEDGLAERIVRDVGMQAGSLPLLQFALQQLWERRAQNTLTHAGYDALGTVTQALARHADDVYARFSEAGKTQLRQLLVQMVRPGEGTEDTRQVMMLPDNPARHEIIRQLANERLVVTRHDEETGEDTVEIVHEALIRHWQRLKEWMKEDRSFRVWQEKLRGMMQHWISSGREEDSLLRGSFLNQAEESLQEYKDLIEESEKDFILRSIKQREINEKEQEELAAYKARVEKEKLFSSEFVLPNSRTYSHHLRFIEYYILANGGYSIAGRECLFIIEIILRRLLENTSMLDDETQQKIKSEEQQFAKGSRGRGIHNFTLGQLVGMIRETRFIEAWAKAVGRNIEDFIILHNINFNELVRLRSQLVHEYIELEKEDAEIVFHALEQIIEAFNLFQEIIAKTPQTILSVKARSINSEKVLSRRTQLIKKILDEGHYSVAAKECLFLIEGMLRYSLKNISILDEETQQRVATLEKQMAKGSRGKSIDDFTMGQLLSIVRESNFVEAWSKATGRSSLELRLIDMNQLVSLRNQLVHGSPIQGEIDSAIAFFLYRAVNAMYKIFQ